MEEELKNVIDSDAPKWVKPLMDKFKTEICAEVTARVAYSVRLMLNKNLEDIKELLEQAGKEGNVCRQTDKAQQTDNDSKINETQEDRENEVNSMEESFTEVAQNSVEKDNVVFLDVNFSSSGKSPRLEEITGEDREAEENEAESESVEVFEKHEETPKLIENEVKNEEPSRVVASLAEEEKEPQKNKISTAVSEKIKDSCTTEADSDPSFVVCEEPQTSAFLQRERAFSGSSASSEFEVVAMPASITNSQHSYSSADTFQLPQPSDEEDTDVEDFFSVRKRHLEEREIPYQQLRLSPSVPLVETVAQTLPKPSFMVFPGNEENEMETSTKTLIDNDEAEGKVEDFKENTEERQPNEPKLNVQESKPPEDEESRAEVLASPQPQVRPAEKIFTPDFFEQVDAFAKEIDEEKAKTTLPPYAGISLASPLDHPRVFRDPHNLPANRSANVDLEEVLWKPSPYVRSELLDSPAQRRILVNQHSPHHPHPHHGQPVYPVDVPAETLWEGALTRAAQAYNSARNAVDDISGTFSQVRNHMVSELRHPRRAGHTVALARRRDEQLKKRDPRKQEYLDYLKEMGFRNADLNAQLLEQHSYDLEAVVVALDELQNGW